jgi:hypothetical protein
LQQKGARQSVLLQLFHLLNAGKRSGNKPSPGAFHPVGSQETENRLFRQPSS